jgi:hypothetical protein
MLHDRSRYRCPKCGFTAALVIRKPVLRSADVALKCIECATITQHPRDEVADPERSRSSAISLD